MHIRKKINLIIINILLLTLCGCLPDGYEPPQQGKMAYFSSVRSPELFNATAIIFKDGYDCRNGEDITSIIRSGQLIRIPADQEVAFKIGWTQYLDSCNFLFSFSPEANQNYVFSFDITGRKCLINVNKISQEKVIPIKLNIRKENIWAPTVKYRFCDPLVKSS